MIEGIESPVKDLWRIFRVMAEFTEGFDELASVGPAVSIFGSARSKPDEKYYTDRCRAGAGRLCSHHRRWRRDYGGG